uniref:Uncharacterized protein n=1 Tax=Aegilops tauschii subsp. strangulata TaxID=200361 RepID=A0A453T901_AEGTS
SQKVSFMASSNNNKMAKGGSSKTVTPLKIHSASTTSNTRQHDAASSRAATGGSSKTVTPLKIHSASPTPNTRQQEALNARAATAMSMNPVTPVTLRNAGKHASSASGMPASGRRPSTTEQQKQSQASSTGLYLVTRAGDQPRRQAPSSSASNRNGQSSASSSQRGHAESHGAGKPKSTGTKNK